MATTLYTIGFTRSTAAHFFGRLRQAGIRRLIDVRLHNTSTLAGFTRRDDLAFFLRELLDAEYIQEPLLTPTPRMLREYQGGEMGWDTYMAQYRALIESRGVAAALDRSTFKQPSVLLCSEATSERCHRRLAAEYLARAWGGLEIIHL
jgi:uncharacterized protein (DUF488 family)